MNSELEDKCLIENDIAEIIDSFNAIEPDTYQTKRTIDEVLDKETGDIIKSEDFFKKNESELIQYRRRLAEAIAGYKLPKFVCAYCGQLLKLSGKQTRRGQVSFFAHLHDSDDCEIKTNGEFTKEEIEIRKYSNIRESQRHIDLKNEIANALEGTRSKEIGIKDVEIEKRITSNVPYLYWKQPDIFAQFNDKSIVFELQLSTTFLSAIIDRDIFYRLNNTFIVWIFNFSDNQEYVNLSNLMCKDIYYSNKRNAFVFDNKARELSKKDGELVLLCIWFEPFVENGIFNPEKSVRKEAYIRMSDLKFDDEIFKPYFVDADSMFFKYQPDLSSNRINIEQLITIRLKKTEKQRLEREYLQNKKNEKISELKEQIKNGIAELKPFAKKEKYGFECNGITIIEPTYSEVTKDSENGYYKVKRNKKYGLIDFQGKEVLSCDYKELIIAFKNKCIVNEKNEWLCVDVKTKYKDFIYKPQIRDSIFVIERISIVAYIIRIEAICGLIHNNNKFCEYDIINDFIGGRAKARKNYRWGIIDEQGSTIIPFEYYYIEKNVDGKYHVKNNRFQGIYDENGNVIVNCKYEVIEDLNNYKYKVKDDYYWGIVDYPGNTISPNIYIKIKDFINDRASAFNSDEHWGVIDTKGNTVIPFEYNDLGDFINGIAKAMKNYYWGYIDVNGNTVIPFEYNDLGDFVNGIAKAMKNYYWGYIDVYGNTIIPFKYNDLGDFINGIAKANINDYCGCIDEKGKTVIPFEYNEICKFKNGKFRANKNNWWGYIDEDGKEIMENISEIENGLLIGSKFRKWGIQSKNNEIIVPFEYDEIFKIKNGKLKVKKKAFWGFIDEKGNTIIPLEFDQIEEFYNGKAKAMKKLKWGFINECGDVIIPFEFNQIAMFNNGKAKAMKNFSWGYINENGDVIIPFEYDKIEELNNGIVKAKKNSKWGLINKYGVEITLFIFDEIGDFINGTAIAKKNHLKIIIDEEGNEVLKGKISNIVEFGIFIVLENKKTGLLHISELRKHNKSCSEFTLGSQIDVKIIKIDKVTNRITLTLV